MNAQSVKSIIEAYGKRVTVPCWEIDKKSSPDKKYVWIIERPFGNTFQPSNITTHINVKQEFSIHYTGTYIPDPNNDSVATGYLASFEFRSDTPMNGVISKITLILRQTGNNVSNQTFSAESGWINCKSGSKYCYLSKEQWKFSTCAFLIPNFDLKAPQGVGTNFKECIIVIIEFVNVPKSDIPPAISEEQEHQRAALQLNSKLYDSKDFADVQIVVNGSVLMAHKAILAARSPVFKTMMETNMVEKNNSAIKIKDFEPEIIEEMLKYIYTGKADLVTHAEQLLKCSDKYDIQVLMDLCQNYLAKNKSTVGFAKIFELLQLYKERVPILKKSAEEYFKKNENLLIASNEFKVVGQLYPKEFFDLYMSKKRKREED